MRRLTICSHEEDSESEPCARGHRERIARPFTPSLRPERWERDQAILEFEDAHRNNMMYKSQG